MSISDIRYVVFPRTLGSIGVVSKVKSTGIPPKFAINIHAVSKAYVLGSRIQFCWLSKVLSEMLVKCARIQREQLEDLRQEEEKDG